MTKTLIIDPTGRSAGGLADVERRHQEHVEGMFTNASFPESWE